MNEFVQQDQVKKLIARGLSKTIGDRCLWNELNVEFSPGTLTAITGKSGSGKTTLLNVLGLLDQPSAGQIFLDELEITGASSKCRRKLYRGIYGYLFQNYALVEQWTVTKNLRLALKAGNAPRAEHDRRIRRALESVGLSSYEDAAVHQLSGGEQQRVAIARLIAHQPKIILADEPTAALDKANADLVFRHLQDFAVHGAIVVLTTHNKLEAESCDALIRLGVE